MSERTDKALQEFLDSLSQLTGSILYRGPHNWKALPPGDEGHVLAMSQNNELTWQPGPAAGGFSMSAVSPLQWYHAGREAYADAADVTLLTDFGGAPTNLVPSLDPPTYQADPPAIVFDGINQALTSENADAFLLPQPCLYIFVAEILDQTGQRYLFDSDEYASSTARQVVWISGGSPNNLVMFADHVRAFHTLNLPERAVYMFNFDRADSFGRVNNVEYPISDPGAYTHHGFTLASHWTQDPARCLAVKIHEAAVTKKRTTKAERDSLVQSLATDWGVNL